MTSRHRFARNFPSTHKMPAGGKPTHPHSRQIMDQKTKFSTVPEMSPEARRAVLLAREDTKVNNNSSNNNVNLNKRTTTVSRPSDGVESRVSAMKVDSNNNTTSHLNVREKEGKVVATERGMMKNNSSLRTATQISINPNGAKISSSSSRPPRAPNTGTSRSRSSISQNEPPFSMSDNNALSSYFSTNTASNASVYTSNLSSGNNNTGSGKNCHYNSNTNLHAGTTNGQEDDDADDDNDSALPYDDSFDDEEDTSIQKDSFVLALDKALEKRWISRLKGDITDTSQVSKPGTVRALNGGRLTNAQEVVVNVCHDDDTELVFHDDDDESIETVKALSQIRVNIWMEYNSKFPPDNNMMEMDANLKAEPPSREQTEVKKRQPSALSTKSREKSFVPNHQRSQNTTGRGEIFVRNTTNIDHGTGARLSLPVPSKNQNISTPSKRTASNSRLRNVSASPTPSRQSSGTSSRGKINAPPSSTTKPATPLKTRR